MDAGKRVIIHGRRFWGWLGVAALVGFLVAGSLYRPAIPPASQNGGLTATSPANVLAPITTQDGLAPNFDKTLPPESSMQATDLDPIETTIPSTGPTATPETLQAHLSNYWPPYGDINCDYECAHLANGDRWQKWVGKGLACPLEYPLGTIFVVRGQEWTCIDRGERIVVNTDGTIWLDLLLPFMPHGVAWGTLFTVEVRRVPILPMPDAVTPISSP